MSMFLGPIHYMMFGKIKIAADRSKAAANAFTEAHGDEATEAINAALPDGLIDFGDRPLEELLGSNPIHQFLQSLIDRVEEAEATLVTALLYRFPDDAEELLKKTYREHGKACGAEQTGGDGNGTLDDLVRGINQFYLEGMPCDAVSSYMGSGDGLKVQHTECLHKPKWDAVGAPLHTMCGLMNEWVTGFATAINQNASLTLDESIIDGAGVCKSTITI